jgi:transcriptional regulator with PAS, ATPase and Fis domain
MNTKFKQVFNVKKNEMVNKMGDVFFGEKAFQGYVKQSINKVAQGEFVSYIDALKVQGGLKQSMTLDFFPLYSAKSKIEWVFILFRFNPDNDEPTFKHQKDYQEHVEVLNSLDNAICITNKNFEIKYFNQKGRKIFNKNNTIINGRKCYELIHSSNSPPKTCPLEKYNKTSQLCKETITFFENGHIIKVTPICDKQGNCSSILHQITPNIKAKSENLSMEELRLRTIEQELHKLNDFKKRLRKKYPELTSYNLTHAALIRMNLPTKETAKYFNVNHTSIQRAKVRLKKKLNLPREANLFDFLLNFK